MNPQPPEWSRLVSAARSAPRDTRDESAPYGFATRVVARAFAGAPLLEASLFSRYGLRALAISCLLAVAGVAAAVQPVMSAIEEQATALGEPPAEVDTIDFS